MEESHAAANSPYATLERQVDKLLERQHCVDLKQPLLNSLDDIAESDLEPEQLAAQWLKEWMAKYGYRLPIDLDQALELCDLALSVEGGGVNEEGSRKMGEDISVMLPIPSGHFHESQHDTMAPVPLPAMGASWYPPTATCDPMTDEEGGGGVYCSEDESDTDSNPINVNAL